MAVTVIGRLKVATLLCMVPPFKFKPLGLLPKGPSVDAIIFVVFARKKPAFTVVDPL